MYVYERQIKSFNEPVTVRGRGATSFRYTGLIVDSSNQMELFLVDLHVSFIPEKMKTKCILRLKMKNVTLISKYGFRYAGTEVQRANLCFC